jgi:hypothetical protein
MSTKEQLKVVITSLILLSISSITLVMASARIFSLLFGPGAWIVGTLLAILALRLLYSKIIRDYDDEMDSVIAERLANEKHRQDKKALNKKNKRK